jgi:uncharacterized membrane-anchored protein YitT (DUF2179 family)
MRAVAPPHRTEATTWDQLALTPHRRPLVRFPLSVAQLGRIGINLALLTLGNAVFVYGMKALLIPHEFLSGGVLGVCLIINFLSPDLNLGLLNLALNLPLYWLGWKYISRVFMLYTAYGIVIFSALTEFLPVAPLPVYDPFLAAILAGIICGAGCGIYMRSLGSGGGLDILGVYLEKRFSLRRGLTIFIASALVLAGAAIIFNLEMALYTLIFSFTCNKVLDAVLTGLNQRKSVLIISDQAAAISQAILSKLNRGATLLKAAGAYSGQERTVILCVAAFTEISRPKGDRSWVGPPGLCNR